MVFLRDLWGFHLGMREASEFRAGLGGLGFGDLGWALIQGLKCRVWEVWDQGFVRGYGV